MLAGSGGFFRSFDEGEVIPDHGFVVDKCGVETMGIEIKDE